MAIEVKVPALPESVADATVLNWQKQPGESVERDEVLVELETDKVVLEVPAPTAGVLQSIAKNEGDIVVADDLLAIVEEGAVAATSSAAEPAASSAASTTETLTDAALSPAVRRLVAEHSIDASQIKGSGKGGRIITEDVQQFLASQQSPAASAVATAIPAPLGERAERRVPMSRLRARVAERLLEAQHNAAILTTFNEVNLQAVMELRATYKDRFEKTHGVRLGFMSFFSKAAIEALKRFPAVNASVDKQDVIYHEYYDIGMAVSTERGLVVPVIRDADKKSMAEIEKTINDYALRARENKLKIEEIQGGTFTITNGGVFGSLLSTPIINPPQTGILGMHKIEQRAVVENGAVVARPMMYIALSYDHRLVDGKDSVQFLVTIKELLEDPARLLLDV